MWKSLRDGFRYRKKAALKEKSGKSGDEGGSEEADEKDDWPFKDALSFLLPTTSKYPRKTTALGMLDDSIDSVDDLTGTDIDTLSECKSNYSYVSIVIIYTYYS